MPRAGGPAGRTGERCDRSRRPGLPYRRAHSAILMASALRGAGAAGHGPRALTREAWLPVTALPMRVLPDLRGLEQLMDRIAGLDVELAGLCERASIHRRDDLDPAS